MNTLPTRIFLLQKDTFFFYPKSVKMAYFIDLLVLVVQNTAQNEMRFHVRTLFSTIIYVFMVLLITS